MSIAERIRYLVKRHPKSRQEIANDLYISTDCLGNYITGRRCPDAAMVRNMAMYFQVSADYILCVAPVNPALPTMEQEENLLTLFRMMTPMQRELFLRSGYGITNYAEIRQMLSDDGSSV